MVPGTVLFVSITYIVMVVAYKLRRFKRFHISVMCTVMIIDLMFPIYLYLNKDWVRRLIDEEEILSFLVWMHVMVIITLYVLYVVQIQVGRKLLKGNQVLRKEHYTQGVGIFVVRALVIITGALLLEPDMKENF